MYVPVETDRDNDTEFENISDEPDDSKDLSYVPEETDRDNDSEFEDLLSDYVSDSCLSHEADYIQPITIDPSNSKIEQDYTVTSTSNNRVSHKNESVSQNRYVRLQASSNEKGIRVG